MAALAVVCVGGWVHLSLVKESGLNWLVVAVALGSAAVNLAGVVASPACTPN